MALSERPEVIASRLCDAGVLRGKGSVDAEYYALLLGVTVDDVNGGLSVLVEGKRLTKSQSWKCPSCGGVNGEERPECFSCDDLRSASAALVVVFDRNGEGVQRDPAALFLIHGMNTFGDWQQALSWKASLFYGYSIPVFIFKFGRDLTSPMTGRAQKRRVEQLARALRKVQGELAASGRAQRCDVVAHSFGTLLIAQMLMDPKCADIVLGRVVLSGSIIPRGYNWQSQVANKRIEAVLNHRAGRDVWVRLAPWLFPSVGTSGVSGFTSAGVHDVVSPSFRHSDFFSTREFANVFTRVWLPFLNGGSDPLTPAGQVAIRTRQARMADQRYWIGRALILCSLLSAIGIARVLLRVLCSMVA